MERREGRGGERGDESRIEKGEERRREDSFGNETVDLYLPLKITELKKTLTKHYLFLTYR
jgi:hypothetical protein